MRLDLECNGPVKPSVLIMKSFLVVDSITDLFRQ